MTDHLARAKDYIAKGEDYYRKAAEEIVAAMAEGISQAEVAREVGRSRRWVYDLLKWRDEGAPADASVFGGGTKGDKGDRGKAKSVLRDPDQRRQVLRGLDPAELEAVREDATEAVIDRARARKAEHATEPTADDLMGGDRFDPAEYWADTLVIRVNRNARELAGLMKRAGGLLFGTMPPAEAFDYLHEAERLIAEARAAAQEQVRDGVEV